MRKSVLLTVLNCAIVVFAFAQLERNPGSNHGNRFEQLDFLLPDPNEYRTASGAPGPKYWQQRADYDISCELDEPNNILTGSETVTYYNNSPDQLTYIWFQIDENFHHPMSNNNFDRTGKMQPNMTDAQLRNLDTREHLKGYGVNITKVADEKNASLKYTINQTMMRIDLPVALKPGQKFVFKIDWNYKIPDKATRPGRGGYEYFAEDGNNLYSITQWFPRLAVYSDFTGWQHLQFTGGSEFALTFGNYRVRITVPADHIVAATGVCQNYKTLLTAAQQQRWQTAQTVKEPVEIVTLSEALETSKQKSKDKKTWIFDAENVRDFAFNSSRRLVWDAMPVYIDGKKVMCMSFYGKEAYPIYRKYSTKATAHTLKVYSKHTIPYPYPVAQSVEAAIGMEYPMLAMNFGRAEKDGTYSEAIKYGAIGVIIHEVGHNFFPMIVNSDERQWWWMDEGLNTFCQFLAEQEFDNNYPSRRGPAHLITDYMKLPKDQLEPIMTKGDAVANVGSNAYAKAATGLNILRETVMGRELFDFSFREYARRWAFKHPTPADLFRTMEDASGIDLDYYWRGWYFGTDPVDVSLDSVKWFKMDDQQNAAALSQKEFITIGQRRNKEDKSINFYTDADTALRDFYYFNRGADAKMQQEALQQQADAQKDTDNSNKWVNKNFYELTFSNKGGMVMPVIVEWTFKDGSKEVDRIPVTVWRANEKQFSKVFVKDKEVASIKLDPDRETADINESNGMWPVKEMPSRFQLFKSTGFGARGQGGGGNAMQKAQQKKN
ncbi:MAG: M1 family metallopeptidase [Chitinophagaceae bacterium]|nr:M1 family metallopeptidase [Chitinophagaceae bacterium]